MTRLRVHSFSISLDGYAAGPDQSLDDPIGRGGQQLHEWLFTTHTIKEKLGIGGDELGFDDDLAREGFEGIGATIMGRNMFSPGRGPWDMEWTGWWGDEPPFGHPVFVLTHHERAPLEVGATTFHFVTGGVHEAHDRAVEAAAGADVRIGGGASTIRQFLAAGLVDELHLVVAPVLLGAGERLFDGSHGDLAGWKAEVLGSTSVVHVRMTRG